MTEQNFDDLIISGSGRASGGKFKKVSISGSGEITSDVECEKLSISGSGHLQGRLSASRASISGSGKIDGDVDCKDEFKISGWANLDGNLKCGELKVSGDSHLGGSVDAEEVHISGSTKINGDCNAEKFFTSGGFNIGGLLNAGTIELQLHPWGSRVRDIGGEKISVFITPIGFIGNVFKAIFSAGHKYILQTGTIEGDDISLCKTKADVVRGANIKIGEGCEIGLVEYTGTYEKAADAVVREEKKI